MPDLVNGAKTLESQIKSRWPDAKVSAVEEKPVNSKGLLYGLDISFTGHKNDLPWFSEQFRVYCKDNLPGSVRVKSIRTGNVFASGQNPNYSWVWVTSETDIGNSIRVEFSTHGEQEGMEFNVPILRGSDQSWDESSPDIDRLMDSISLNAATRQTFLLSSRLKELGFIEEGVMPEGKQRYPKLGIRKMQDYMGWDRTDYSQELHWNIWYEMKVSDLG